MATGLQKLQHHIKALELKHTKLERALQLEEAQLHPDENVVHTIKKNKLLIKDQITALQERVDRALNGNTSN